MGELRQYRYREVPGRKKQYASSLLSDQYLAVLSTVCGCTKGSRGAQTPVRECSGFCEKQAFLYPEHLRMVGRYNSLFGVDLDVWRRTEELKKTYVLIGVNRVVMNLL